MAHLIFDTSQGVVLFFTFYGFSSYERTVLLSKVLLIAIYTVYYFWNQAFWYFCYVLSYKEILADTMQTMAQLNFGEYLK